MSHVNPNFNRRVEETMDKWEEVKNETEEKIVLGRLEMDHLKLVDKIEEDLIAISNKESDHIDDVKHACDEAENLRSRVRRKLLKQGTATEIPHKQIISAIN